jgi:hypothetical protein
LESRDDDYLDSGSPCTRHDRDSAPEVEAKRKNYGDNDINLINETPFMEFFMKLASGNLINKILIIFAIFNFIFCAIITE